MTSLTTIGNQPVTAASIFDLLAAQDNLVTRMQSLVHMSSTQLGRRLSDEWRIVLPGVYLASKASPTDRQRLRAAVLYAGPRCQINDLPALEAYGVRYLPTDPTVRLLLPAKLSRANRDGVAVRRTHRPPEPRWIDGLPYSPPARAVLDCAARLGDRRDAVAMIADVVQRKLASAAEIDEEGTHLNGRGAAATRLAIAAVMRGVRSAPESDMLDLLTPSRELPPLMLNPLLRLPDGSLMSPDGLIAHCALAYEVNSREHHEGEDLFDDMQARHDLTTTAGLVVLHNSPRQIRTEGRRIKEQVLTLCRQRAGLGLPPGVEILRAGPPG